MFKKILKKSYVYIILAIFYIPLFVGAVFSFSAGSKKGDMHTTFNYSAQGWKQLSENDDIAYAIANTSFIALFVAIAVVILSLLTVFGLWRQKNIGAKAYVQGTTNIPLINPDIITAISMAIAFSTMFGVLERHNTGYERLLISQTTMILPFGITIMYPRSEKFKQSLFEASKDLGYGTIKTWFKTYFRHMLPVASAVFVISIAMSFDDFIITRVVSKETTVGSMMYEGSLDPWVLAMGTIFMGITLSVSGINVGLKARKQHKLRKAVK